jgi:hypothetical protein
VVSSLTRIYITAVSFTLIFAKLIGVFVRDSDRAVTPIPDYIAAFQAIDTPCALIDKTGVIRDANDAYLGSIEGPLVGTQKADCIGRHLANFLPQRLQVAARSQIESALALGRSFDFADLLNGEPEDDDMRQMQLQILTDGGGRVNGGLITGDAVATPIAISRLLRPRRWRR